MDNQTKNITHSFWEYVESNRDKSKLHENVYQWLNKDNLNAIILDKKIFWIENGSNIMPNYVYTYIKKWGKKQGYTFVFDIVPSI